MADQNATTPNQPAPEVSTQPQGSAPTATPAPVAGEDAAALKAQLDSLSKWKAEAEADLKKYRDARKATEDKATAERAEYEKKLREQGQFAELAKVAEEKAKALEAQLAQFSAKASQYDAIESEMSKDVEAAKASPDLPGYIKTAIASARDVYAANKVLGEYRAEQAKANPAKQPAPHAPAQGAAPASPKVSKTLDQMTPQEILSLTPEERDAHFKANGARGSINWGF